MYFEAPIDDDGDRRGAGGFELIKDLLRRLVVLHRVVRDEQAILPTGTREILRPLVPRIPAQDVVRVIGGLGVDQVNLRPINEERYGISQI